MQRRDHTRCASLTHIIKRNRIVRPVPTPGLFHCPTLSSCYTNMCYLNDDYHTFLIEVVNTARGID
ncbi:Uncharacterised protein [Enterobacter cloacae]|nr:Uncharacterised protein [Enterobacter cloacae]